MKLKGSTFHAKCDNKGSTLFIAKCGATIFGAYANASWNSNGQYT